MIDGAFGKFPRDYQDFRDSHRVRDVDHTPLTWCADKTKKTAFSPVFADSASVQSHAILLIANATINDAKRDPLFSNAVRAMSWSSASTAVNTLIGLGGFFLLVRLLGPTNYGLVAMASVALAIPTALCGDALSQSLIQQEKLDRSAQTTTFILELAVSLFFCAVLVLSSGMIAERFDEPVVATLIVALCPLLILRAAISVPAAQLRRNLQFKAIAVINAVSIFLSVSVGVTLALLDYGYWALVAMQLVQPMGRTVGVFIASGWRPSAKPSWSSIKPLMHFNVQTIALKVLRAITASLPRALIGGFLGAAALGVFDVSRRLFKRISGLLMQPLTNVTLPVASKLQNDMEGLRQWHRFSSVVITALAYPLYIGIAAVLPVAVPVLFGDKWLDAVLPMQLMMLVGVRNATAIFNGGILRGLGKPELTTRIAITSLAISSLLLPPAVSFGVSALVGALLVGSIASWLVGTYYVDREIGTGIAEQVVIGWESLVSAIVMFGAVTLAHQLLLDMLPGWAMLPLLGAVGGIVHYVALLMLQPDVAKQFRALAKALLARDRAALKSMLQSGIGKGAG